MGGGVRLQRGLTAPPNPPTAKFASQGDAHMRTNAQTKCLYYPLKSTLISAFGVINLNMYISLTKYLQGVEERINENCILI